MRFRKSCAPLVSVLIFAFISSKSSIRAQENLINTGDVWTYWDLGPPPENWAQPSYSDFDWETGPSPLGFGPGEIVATSIRSGIMTAYFRFYFFIDPVPAAPVSLRVRRDDGVVVYLNGWEVFRDNMPDGPVDYDTRARLSVEALSFLEATVDPSFFEPGLNVMAAEVHQQQLGSSDLVFDLQLTNSNAPPGRTVTITSPADNTTVAPGNDVTITAFAGPAGDVDAVEFYEGDNLLGIDQQAPYQVVWPAPPAGNYVLRAIAVFNDSITRTSAPVNLTVAGSINVVRGPYLQMGTPNSIFVKWRTDVASDSLVRYGLSPDNLDGSTQVSTLTTEHEVQLTSLSPDTKYYYSVGSSSDTHAGGPSYFFVTSPPSPKPTRVWVIGDSGTASQAQRDVWVSYNNYTAGRYTDVWLMLGDNAYNSGTDAEYQRGMFNIYPELLRQTVVWPTIGNHDANPAYFDIFTLPRNGEAGGIASGMENYYSFDYGSIHFICLGGYYSGSRLSNEVMCTWLKADLEANTNKWLIAYWHQPPYTKGSHDSDWEHDLIEMRENAVPILESYGVDLVLCGHSHCYERSYLLSGHYGFSSELQPEMLLDTGSGRVGDTGPYMKQANGHGTVYVVAGSSGHTTFGSLNHPVMYLGFLRMGALVLDIDGDTLNGTFIRENGDIDDYFTLAKPDPARRITEVSYEDGLTQLTWASTPGKHYKIEYTSDLGISWAPASGIIPSMGSITSGEHLIGRAARQAFYRVMQID